MIYRIAVYRDGKFDHYATPEELCLLRVNADGRVEALMVNGSLVTHPPRFHLLDVELDDDGDTPMGVYGKWYDVSDTHKVEWGYILPHIGRVYVNDIIGYADHDSSYNEHIGTFAMDVMYWGYNRGQYATGKVIGNIHETPNCCHGRTHEEVE